MTRRTSGREAQRRGSAHEAWVADHCREAVRLGILVDDVVHNEPHGKLLGGQWVMVAPGVADFTGVLHNGHGTTLAIEAKARAGRLLKSEITREQQWHLDAVARAGGAALLAVRLVEVEDDGDVRIVPGFAREFVRDYAVPWAEVPWVVLKSAPSVGVENLTEWMVAPNEKCFLERFCPVRGVPARSGRRHPRE